MSYSIRSTYIKIVGHYSNNENEKIEGYVRLDGVDPWSETEPNGFQLSKAYNRLSQVEHSYGHNNNYVEEYNSAYNKACIIREKRDEIIGAINNFRSDVLKMKPDSELFWYFDEGVFDDYEEENSDAFFKINTVDDEWGDCDFEIGEMFVWFPNILFWFNDSECSTLKSNSIYKIRKPVFVHNVLDIYKNGSKQIVIDDVIELTEVWLKIYSRKDYKYKIKITNYDKEVFTLSEGSALDA